jgi:hypothetical protein
MSIGNKKIAMQEMPERRSILLNFILFFSGPDPEKNCPNCCRTLRANSLIGCMELGTDRTGTGLDDVSCALLGELGHLKFALGIKLRRLTLKAKVDERLEGSLVQ